MRKAYNDFEFVQDEQDNFIGISLGYDYCAEHEWGIEGIKSKLGIPRELVSENFGLDFRTVSIFNEKELSFFETKKIVAKKTNYFGFLFLNNYWKVDGIENIPYDLSFYVNEMSPNKRSKEGREIITAWDENSFGIVVRNKENIKKLEELYEAFKQKNICIGLFGGGVFKNPSLTIAIKSKIPQEIKENIKKSDIESFKLLNLKEEWGKKIKKSGKQNFYGLSISFFNYFDIEKEKESMKKNKTAYNYLIWINISNENSGWYIVEQVIEWLKSKKELSELKK